MTQKITYINNFVNGDRIDDIFLISEASLRESKNGPFWNLKLQDQSGSIEAKIWSPLSMSVPELNAGMFITAQGTVGSYRDKQQLTIDNIRIYPQDVQLDITDFLPSSKEHPEDMFKELEYLVAEHISHAPLKKFCKKVLKSDEIKNRLLIATGAKSVHHAYVGGLLEHTLSVSRLSMSIAANYPEVDKQLLLAGAIFHDLGKAWELSSGIVNDYTDEGKLLGHIYLGLEKLEPFLEKAKDLDEKLKLHLKHLILSHHGEYEYGAPKRPKTPEAFILHFADNIDAKMNTIYSEFDKINNSDKNWTPYQPFLSRYLYKPEAAPVANQDSDRKKEEAQCSLPLKV